MAQTVTTACNAGDLGSIPESFITEQKFLCTLTPEHAKDFYQKVLQNIGGETLAALRTQEFMSLPHPHLLGEGRGGKREGRVWADGRGGGHLRGTRRRAGGTETSLEAEEEQQHTGLPLPGPTASSLRCLAGHRWRNLLLSSSTNSSGATSGSGETETRTKGTDGSHALLPALDFSGRSVHGPLGGLTAVEGSLCLLWKGGAKPTLPHSAARFF